MYRYPISNNLVVNYFYFIFKQLCVNYVKMKKKKDSTIFESTFEGSKFFVNQLCKEFFLKNSK